MVTTKIYRNTGDKDLNVIGVGQIPAGEQVSIISEYHQPVVMANYEGLVELVAEEAAANEAQAAEQVTPADVTPTETKTQDLGGSL
jgi:hypothetical protein